MLRLWLLAVVTVSTVLTTAGALFLAQPPGDFSGAFADLSHDPSHDPSLILHAAVTFGGVITILLLRKLLTPKLSSNAFGSASFATPEEMADLFHVEGGQALPGSILLGNQDRQWNRQQVILSPEQARRHGVIVGGSGSGKSFSFFLPNAARLRGTSCVFSDPKSELFRYTSGFHRSLRFAPCEPDASESFNWIPLCRSPRLAEIAARAIVESGKTSGTEQIWLDLEAAYLASLFAHTSTLALPTPLTMYRLFTAQDQKTLLSQLSQSESAVAREQANIFTQASERMRGSIVPAVAARLQFMRDPVISRFCSASLLAPRFAHLRRIPTALYWCLAEKDIPRLRPLTSLFFTLLLEELNGGGESENGAEGASTTRGVGTVPVLLFLDEFGVIGALPDFEATLALARGRGMGIWLGVQSLSQLESVYGRSAAQTILTNCSTKIALSGLDVETAEYFSRSLGQGTIARKMRSWQRRRFSVFASTVSDALQEQGRSLLTADEVRRLPEADMLVVTGNRRPMQLKKMRYTAVSSTARTRTLGPARAAATLFEQGKSTDTDNNAGKSEAIAIRMKPLPSFPDDL